jgi:MFS family permease
VLFVSPQRARRDEERAGGPSLREALGVLRIPRYRALLVAAGVLALTTASDAFIFLALQKKIDLGTSMFPLLFVANAAVYMLMAVPVGRAADRFGRGRVLLIGYALLLGVYGALLLPLGGWPLAAVTLALLGTYYAATDGVLMALASAEVPDKQRASGLALVGTATNVARLAASVIFGALWAVSGIDAAIAYFAVALAIAGGIAAVLLARAPQPGHV